MKLILNLGLGARSLSCSQAEKGFSWEVNSMKPSLTCSSEWGAARNSSHTERLLICASDVMPAATRMPTQHCFPLQAADCKAVHRFRLAGQRRRIKA